jgi:hypothetical protein
MIATAAGVVLFSSFRGPFHIGWASFHAAAIASLLFCIAGRFYSTLRKDPRAAAALFCTAQIALFAAVATIRLFLIFSHRMPAG